MLEQGLESYSFLLLRKCSLCGHTSSPLETPQLKGTGLSPPSDCGDTDAVDVVSQCFSGRIFLFHLSIDLGEELLSNTTQLAFYPLCSQRAITQALSPVSCLSKEKSSFIALKVKPTSFPASPG